jgi:hypothetical protein
VRRSTLLLLLLLVAGLSVLWRVRERERSRGGLELPEYPLLPGLAAERVRALRIDHLERSIQVGLERDAAGRWFLTDPVAYPAQDSLVRTLLQTLALAQGEPADEVDPAQVALDPPLAVLECTQVEPLGERTLRLELGAVALDPDLVHTRVPGHPSASGGAAIFRTVRTLLTTLDRNPDDYRDPRATPLLAQQVTSFRRRGALFLAEEGHLCDLSFDALLEPDGWRQVSAPQVALDPNGILLLVRGAAELTVQRFVDDSPEDLSRYGLEPPAFTVELQDERGTPCTLRFGQPEAGAERPLEELTWFCLREGFAHVWQVEARAVGLLSRPAELLYDSRVLRVLRQDVVALELEGDGRLLELERGEQGWVVRAGAGRGAPGEDAYPASPGAVEDLLGLLERTQLGDYQPGVPFAEEDPPLAFHVRTKGGARLGGRIGRPWRDARSGAQGRLYLRDGDELVGLIGEEVAELCRRPLSSLRGKHLHRLQESLVRAVELSWRAPGGEQRRYTFVNDGNNSWTPEGQRIGAPPDFVRSLDALLNLAVLAWLDGPVAELTDSVAVRVRPLSGEELPFTLGRDAGGHALVVTGAGQQAEIDPALFERLRRLFE